MKTEQKNLTRKLAAAGVLTAVAVVGSTLGFPVAGSKCAPVQHIPRQSRNLSRLSHALKNRASVICKHFCHRPNFFEELLLTALVYRIILVL